MIHLLFIFTLIISSDCHPLPDKNSYGDGVKIVTAGTSTYLVTVGSSSNSGSNINTKSRIATVRARRNVNEYINGTSITSESILETGEVVRNNSVEFYESFKERIVEQGSGFVEGMEVACSWVSDDGKNYYVALFRELN